MNKGREHIFVLESLTQTEVFEFRDWLLAGMVSLGCLPRLGSGRKADAALPARADRTGTMAPGSTAMGFAPQAPGSPLGSSVANVQFHTSCILTLESLRQKISTPESPHSELSSQRQHHAQPPKCGALAETTAPVQIPRAVFPLFPPFPEIWQLTLVIRHLATLLRTHSEPCVE